MRTLDDAIAQNHAALDAMVKSNSSGDVSMLSERDDVTWGNPFGPFARGREGVEAASRKRDECLVAIRHVLGDDREGEIGQPGQQRPEGQAQLDPRERRAEADVDAVLEAEVVDRFALGAEAAGATT